MLRRPPRSTLFPTRRSSDLKPFQELVFRSRLARECRGRGRGPEDRSGRLARFEGSQHATHRSEEHTSELQSRRDLVCRLLLEKKNKRRAADNSITYTTL